MTEKKEDEPLKPRRKPHHKHDSPILAYLSDVIEINQVKSGIARCFRPMKKVGARLNKYRGCLTQLYQFYFQKIKQNRSKRHENDHEGL